MKRLNLCMAAVVLTLSAAPVVRAQDATTTTTTVDMTDRTVTGVIVSSNADQVIITTDAGERMVLNRDATFTIPASLIAGNRVTVTYHGDPNNYLVNHVVVVEPATTTTTTTTTTSTPDYSTTSSSSTSNMPATASPLPLVGLLGALSLGAGVSVRVLTRR